jgi:hypothetical protein
VDSMKGGLIALVVFAGIAIGLKVIHDALLDRANSEID